MVLFNMKARNFLFLLSIQEEPRGIAELIELVEGVCYTDKKYPQKLQMLLREYLRKAGGLDGRESLHISRGY